MNIEDGRLTVWKRDGAFEIHHVQKDKNDPNKSVSGEWQHTNDYNHKFVSTMFNMAKRIIDSGNSVRIIGNHENKMFDRYHRIASVLAKRHGYTVGKPKLHHAGDGKYSEFIVGKNLSEHYLIKMVQEADMKNRNKKNNYGLTNYRFWLGEMSPDYVSLEEILANGNA
jgi:hypothetical protein